MMVRIHTSRWGFYVISGLLCLSIPFLTVISLRHRLNLYLVEEESDPHFNPDITTPLKDGSTPRLATISWSQAALSAPTASVTAVDAAIGEETSEDDQAPPTTSNAAVLPVAPEAAVKSTAEEPAPSASGHAPAISDYNYTLSQAECSAQFPNLYREIDRAVAFRRQIGNVPPSEIDTSWKSSGAVRAMIYNQKVNDKPKAISH